MREGRGGGPGVGGGALGQRGRFPIGPPLRHCSAPTRLALSGPLTKLLPPIKHREAEGRPEMTLQMQEGPVNMVKMQRDDPWSGDPVARRSVPLPCPSMVVPVNSNSLNSKLATFPQPLARPSPSVSNRGLVIVQVQEEQQEAGVSTVDQENKDKSDPGAHQLIHGYPPHTFLAEDEEEDEEEEEEEEEDTDFGPHDESDEGYRTNSSVASGSPLVETAGSPGPEERDIRRRGEVKGEQMVTGRVTETVEDEQGNLMWLVDFKLDFFNDIEKEGGRSKEVGQHEDGPGRKKKRLAALPDCKPESLPASETSPLDSLPVILPTSSPITLPSHSPIPILTSSPTITHQVVLPTLPIPLPIGESNTSQNNEVAMQNPASATQVRTISSAKPNSTYTDLITLALKDKEALTVSGIYQWISENYPYFKAEDDRWKNSVRHNLSMNPHFRKGTKSKQGAGHVWVLADEGSWRTMPGQEETVKLISNEDEAAEAVRKILGSRPAATNQEVNVRKRPRGKNSGSRADASRARRPDGSRGQRPPGDLQNELQRQRPHGDQLQRCAEEILAGGGRPTAVEGVVQFLLPQEKSHGE